MKKKWLAIGIILLFIGVAVAPGINHSVVTASQDDNLIVITSQACGIKGYKDATVKLTREQYQNLEQYLVEFRARLNQTETREEAAPIFREAVNELNKYGLLPSGMSVEQGQNLLIGHSPHKNVDIVTKKMCVPSLKNMNESINRFCLIAGRSSNTFFIPFSSVADFVLFVFALLSSQSYAAYNSKILSMLFFGLSILFGSIFIVSLYVGNIIPLAFLECICLGYRDVHSGYDLIPAKGWISTIGINGVKTWNNSFWGTRENLLIPMSNIGVIGFTGIKLLVGGKLLVNSDFIYLGSALWARIGGE